MMPLKLHILIVSFRALKSGGIVLLLLLPGITRSQAQDPQFKHYTVGEGLSSSTVYSVLQDSKGYLWFCNGSGVNRFDGRNFETFTIADGLADNENFKCFEDSKGRIWFMSYNGRLSYFQDTTFVNETRDSSLHYPVRQGEHIIDLTEDPEGRIWFSTLIQAPRVYDGSRVTESVYKPDPLVNMHHMLYQQKGKVYSLELRDRVRSIDLSTGKRNDLGINYRAAHMKPYIEMQSLGPDSFYFLSSSGISIFKEDSVWPVLLNERLGHEIKGFRLIQNDLWISTESGLVMIPGFKTRGYTGTKRTFLPGFFISSVVQDHEGGIWVTTMANGVYYISPGQSYITGFPGVSYTAISHQAGSELWAAGTYYGDLMIWSGDRLVAQHHNTKANALCIKTLKWISGNELLVGNKDTTFIYNIKTGRLSSIATSSDPNSESIGMKDMSESEDGLWIADRTKILLWDHIHPPKLLFGSHSHATHTNPAKVSIEAGKRNECWVASIQKLYRFDPALGDPAIVAGEELFKANLKDLEYVNGYLWVATDGNGIFIFKDGKFCKHIFSGNSEMPDEICNKLVYDGRGTMWVATNKSVYVYDTGSYRNVMRFSSTDVLINDEIKDLNVHEGKVYIAGASRISVVEISKLRDSVAPPRVYIRQLSVNGRIYQEGTSPEFDQYNGVIVLSYAAITFQANSSLKYRYKIKGQNETWNETHSDRIEFYNLGPGIYTVLLSAKKYNSRWSFPAEYTFTVLPLWYQTWWFKLLLCLLVAGGIGYRIRQIRKREEEKTRINKKIAELKNSALASQMNPHFIFNAINSIQDFIFREDELAANDYLGKFARLMRLFLESSKQTHISIRDEVELLRLYTELEKLRFEEKISFAIVMDQDLDQNLEIPSMLIQPFVENAINHGLVYKESKGHLLIEFVRREKEIVCIIEDDGIGREKSKTLRKNNHVSRGLEMIKERMEVYSSFSGDQAFTFSITDKTDQQGKPGGTRVEILFSSTYEQDPHYYSRR